MKAQESIPRYGPKLREYANYTRRRIIEVCRDIGPRPSGEANEKAAQERFAKELEEYADEVMIEPFSLHPKAFLGWVRLCSIIMIFANLLFCLLGFTEIALALTVISLFFIVTEFLFYGETLDPFFPKRESRNVTAVRKAKGETKRRIVFSGHVDSSYEWRYTYLGGPPLIRLVIGGAVVGLLLSAATEIYALAGVGYGMRFDIEAFGLKAPNTILFVLKIALLAWCVLYIAAIFFLNYKLPVDGANDNLTGSVASMAVMKFLSDFDIRFENTEVCCVLSGAEEAGLRGAKAWAKAHKKECAETETAFIGVDTLRDYDDMAVYHRDMTGLVKSDPRVCALIKEAGETAGKELPYKTIFLGASDAAAVSRAGIPAATLAAMDPSPARYYHTRLDKSDNLDLKTIETGINVMLETLFLYDEKGLS